MNRAGLTAHMQTAYGVEPDYPFEGDTVSAVFRRSDNRKWFALVMRLPAERLGIPGSLLDDRLHEHDHRDHHDHFTDVHPTTNWKSCLDHAEKLGIGTKEYELVKID